MRHGILLPAANFINSLLAPCFVDADLEDEMSDEDIQIAEPAEPLVLAQTTSAAAAACPPVHRRVKIVQIKKHRPSTGPGSRPAAAGSDAGKDKKTAGGRRSFLTLAVSTGKFMLLAAAPQMSVVSH